MWRKRNSRDWHASDPRAARSRHGRDADLPAADFFATGLPAVDVVVRFVTGVGVGAAARAACFAAARVTLSCTRCFVIALISATGNGRSSGSWIVPFDVTYPASSLA